MRAWVLLACLLAPAAVPAHEGDSESRALRLHGLLLALDRGWAAAQSAPDAPARERALVQHARLLLQAHEALRDMAEASPCILLEAGDSARQLACLVDTEARLRGNERLLGHALQRLAAGAP